MGIEEEEEEESEKRGEWRRKRTENVCSLLPALPAYGAGVGADLE